MKFAKRMIVILTLIIGCMLIIPLVAVNTVKADAGMFVVLLLFFAVYPVVSVFVGIMAGKDIKNFWYTPIGIAGLFWLFSSFTYKTAFPVVYSVVYFTLCCIGMWITAKKHSKIIKEKTNNEDEKEKMYA